MSQVHVTNVSSGPATEPVTKDEVEAHLRIAADSEDTFLDTLIKAARGFVENETRRALITQTLVLTLDHFPPARHIFLENAPLQSVTSVQYVDSAGSTQTFSSSSYSVSTAKTPGQIALSDGETWPVTKNEIDAVTITYVAGYGSASDVPQAIKQAMLMLIGHWYENREDETLMPGISSVKVEKGVDRLLRPYRVTVPGV